MSDLASRTYGFYNIAPQRQGGVPDVTASAGRMFALSPEPQISKPRLAPDDPRHGTPNGYNNHNCRCDDCKAAQRVDNMARRRERLSRPIPDHVHGTDNGYTSYKCKCPACAVVGRAYRRRQYKPSPRRGLERAKTEAMYADYSAGMSVDDLAKKWGMRPNAIYCRFNRAGLKRRGRSFGTTSAMYIDYCTGMSTAEVAEKWGVRSPAVTRRFKELGLPLRSRRGQASCVVPVPGVSWEDANRVRAEMAGVRRADAARHVLPRTVDETRRQVLQLRIAHPRMSLAELAKRCDPPMTKDMYASYLRRALANAGVAS